MTAPTPDTKPAARVDPADWTDIENRLRAIHSRLAVRDALTSAVSGDADTIRAKLVDLAPDQLAAVVHRADMLIVVAEGIQRERITAQP